MNINQEIEKEEMKVQNLVKDWHSQKLVSFIDDLIKKDRAEQLILSGVSNRLNEVTLEEINTIMWESHMIKSRTFDRTQGTMIMKELEKWAKR
jgi:hypothetical protein